MTEVVFIDLLKTLKYKMVTCSRRKKVNFEFKLGGIVSSNSVFIHYKLLLRVFYSSFFLTIKECKRDVTISASYFTSSWKEEVLKYKACLERQDVEALADKIFIVIHAP
jgi:hypothetical protein